MLAGEGYTVGDGARGTIVNPALPRSKKSISFAERRRAGREHAASTRVAAPEPLLFQMGLPALDVFPRKQWAQIAARVARRLDVEQLAYPHD